MAPDTLPVPRTTFVGRCTEIAELRRLVPRARLTTLVGPGGVGKTRLAVQVAAQVRDSFPDGVCFADLALLSDPALLPQHVAAALDLRDSSPRWLVASIADVLAARRALLVLDNCEHLRDACAVLVDTLLTECPQVRVVATSRSPLDVAGETLFPVHPLPAAADAVDLLVERATARAPGFALTDANRADVLALCRHLDGMPLALELAAVRLRTLSPAQLVDRLDDRLDLLRHSRPGAPERHRTLHAAVQWSYRLLTPAEQVLWRRAAVFVGDFDLAAAEAVGAGPPLDRRAVLDTLTGLVDKSVLDVVRQPAGVRFRMLETVRVFGRQLLEPTEREAIRRRHRDHYARLAAAADWTGPDQVAQFDRFATEHGQLRAALDFSVQTPGEAAAGLRLAADLWLYWQARGQLSEGQRWLARLLACYGEPTATRARGLAVAGYLALARTDPASAVPLLQQALDLADALDEPAVAAFCTQYLGLARLFVGDLDGAETLLRHAASAYRRAGEDAFLAFVLADLGMVAFLRGDLDGAAGAFTGSLALTAGGDPWTQSHATWGMGLVRWRTGALDEAQRLQRAALSLMRQVDDRSGVALAIDALSWLAGARGHWRHAATLAGAADTTWLSIPARRPGPLVGFRDECVDGGRLALGGAQWEARYTEGTRLDRGAAVRLALGDTPAGPTGGALTPRQQQVALLVADGLTDREIAARLYISTRTAESHVEQILARLGFRSRAQVAGWVAGGSA
jgi:non-specific serine/threonine protein kinase